MQQTEALLGRQVSGLAALLAGRLCVLPSMWAGRKEVIRLDLAIIATLLALPLHRTTSLPASTSMVEKVLLPLSSPQVMPISARWVSLSLVCRLVHAATTLSPRLQPLTAGAAAASRSSIYVQLHVFSASAPAQQGQ